MFVPLTHIFNYIPSSIRVKASDDDQLKSYALQGWRLLNHSTRFVKDIAFLDVVNHKASFPAGIKRIQSVRRYVDQYFNDECFESICNDFELPQNDSFANPCNIQLKTFLQSEFYNHAWSPVIRIKHLTQDYLCKHADDTCKPFYSLDVAYNIATFSFNEGVVALEYYRNLKKNDEFLLPEEPEVLWHYLGAFTLYKYFEEEYALGMEGALGRMRTYQEKAGHIKDDAKRALIHQEISPFLARHMIFDSTRMIKMPSFQQRLQNWRANV